MPSERRPARSGLIVVCLCLIVAASVAPIAAEAREVKGFTLTPNKPTVEREYEGFSASAPTSGAAEATYSPTVCRDAEYCDTIDIDFLIPEDYEYKWKVRITTSWEFEDNDLDTWLYDLAEAEVKSAATGANPEIIEAEKLDPDRYHIVVLSFLTVVPDPYTVKVEFIQGAKIEARQRKVNPFQRAAPPAEPPDTAIPAPLTQPAPESAESPISFEPLRVNIPQEGTRSGRAPIPRAGRAAVPGIEWDTGRVVSGIVALLVVSALSYSLFFAPRRRRAKPAPA